MFGPNAKDFVIQSLSYPVAFPPKPNTFGSDGYAFVIDDIVASGGYENMGRGQKRDCLNHMNINVKIKYKSP